MGWLACEEGAEESWVQSVYGILPSEVQSSYVALCQEGACMHANSNVLLCMHLLQVSLQHGDSSN